MTAAHATTIIENATLYMDGQSQLLDVAIKGDKILAIGDCRHFSADETIDATGLVLSAGFVDVHTHDDLEVLRNPHMLSKVSQGVTTVIAGNCGLSAVPYLYDVPPVDPINLLGSQRDFVYQNLAHYRTAFSEIMPSVNLAMLIGHTSLRAQVMNDLSQPATDAEIEGMVKLLHEALSQGAIGLSSGLAYYNANAASSAEVNALAQVVHEYGGVYTTHLRTEFQGILAAMDEAFNTAKQAKVPLVISHIKCAGPDNWGRAGEVLNHLKKQTQQQSVCCDCYPYAASSSTLDLKQVTDKNEIFITWSEPHPEVAKQSLAAIANQWGVSLLEAARRLQPAGAVYHCMLEADVKTFLSYEHSMVGSDGLPCDPHPHPRLWGAFPRVLGHYCRDEQALSLGVALHKMTALPAARFGLNKRGHIKPGYFADLVLFDPLKVKDQASYADPKQMATGIEKVWVNGVLSYEAGVNLDSIARYGRAGLFLPRQSKL